MMYYINKPTLWKAANKKCEEAKNFVEKFNSCLVKDNLSRDALVEEIRHKIQELNDSYPRLKQLYSSFSYNQFFCWINSGTEDKLPVFSFILHPVEKSYSFAENAAALEGGGE